ncbi:MAG: hypothetical protein ABI675_23800 [Chitinophagaceae bacterium]
MKGKIEALLITTFYFFTTVTAQVPVSEEPRHVPVVVNEYIRLLDVWLPPGDTTWFHIHSTPSVFVPFTNTLVTSEAEDEDWKSEQMIAGKVWYRSFTPDSLIHRVANLDSTPFHVNDIEILSYYDTVSYRRKLYFPLLFDNDRVTAYNLTRKYYATSIVQDRGPIIVALISGDLVYYTNTVTNQKSIMKAGEYLYIDPESSFYFSFKGNQPVNMILFEIK